MITVRALRTSVLVLASLGLIAAAVRGIGVIESHFLSDGQVPELSRFDQVATPLISRLTGVQPGTDAYAQLDRDSRRFYRKFNQHPIGTLAHVLPAALFMVLAPVQFVSSFRNRSPAWHRWSGRVVIAAAIPIGLTGLFFGLFMPFAGRIEASAIAVFNTWFLISLVQAVVAIRGRDIDRHRVWMIRMFAVALGVSTVRLFGLLLAVVSREGPAVWFGLSVWLGFGSTVLLAELWIRSSNRTRSPASSAAPV